MRLLVPALSLLMAALTACAAVRPPTAPSPDAPGLTPQPSALGLLAAPDSARMVLDAALDAMQAKAYYADRVDWPGVRARAYARAAGAQTPAETHPAIREALAALGDGHSFLLAADPPPAQTPVAGTKAAPPHAYLTAGVVSRLIETPAGSVGYVRVPSFMGGGADAERFADSLLAAVRRADEGRPVGWIVDVRLNGGGNVWPMLAGLAPLLGNGVVGGSINVGSTRDWMALDGPAATYVTADTTLEVIRTTSAYSLAAPRAPVAVLTDRATGSSAEAVALAFVGRPGSRRFGEATAGASSSNEGTELPDGSVLVITTGLMTDRTGKAYGVRIEPDEDVADDPATEADETLGAAQAWLLSQ